MKKRERGIIRYVFLVLTGMLIGLGLFLANAQVLGRDPMPMPFGTGIAVVSTGSMEPALSKNDLVIVHREAEYHEGEIVVYRSGIALICHRIVRIEEQSEDTKEIETSGRDKQNAEKKLQIIAKGDANNAEDAPASLASVKGRVVFRIPLMGALLNFIRSGTGLLILIIAAALLIELPYRQRKRKDTAELDQIREKIRRLREEYDQADIQEKVDDAEEQRKGE